MSGWQRSPWFFGALAGAIALAAGILWRQLAAMQAFVGNAMKTLGQWKGKVLIVNFWATWCEPCKEEMPRFIKLQDEFGPKGLQFVGVAIDQPEKVRAFAKDIGLNYPTLVGGYGAIELSKTLGNRVGALPFTVVLDRAGGVVHTQLGPVKDAQLQSMIRQLI